ncbi:hypothetical protein FCV25MIE_08553 [Fagus crenata]
MSTTYILLLVFLLGAVALTTPSLAHIENTQGNSYSVSSEPWSLPPRGGSGQLIIHGLRIDTPEVHHTQDSFKPVASEEKKQPECWGLIPTPPGPPAPTPATPPYNPASDKKEQPDCWGLIPTPPGPPAPNPATPPYNPASEEKEQPDCWGLIPTPPGPPAPTPATPPYNHAAEEKEQPDYWGLFPEPPVSSPSST